MKDSFFKNIKIIDEMVVAGDYPNVNKFHEKIPVDERTIRRYLKFIRETLCLPLKYDPQKKGFYYENKNKSLKEFFAKNSASENIVDDEADEKKKRKELIDILKNNVTRKGLKCPGVSENIKEHIRSTERNLSHCKTVEEVLLYYDFALRSKTGKEEVAKELKRNGLLCFESKEVRAMVDKYRK